MEIESFITNDLQQLSNLQPEGWGDIMPKFEEYLQWKFCMPVKIVIDNKIAGIGTGIIFGKTAWLAHIIVMKKFRKQGIGSAIVTQLIRYLSEQGCKTISLIATDAGYPVYKRAGFIEQTEYIFFENKNRSNLFNKSESIDNIKLSGTDIKCILQLDKKISGENREQLITSYLDNIRIYRSNDKIKGYYLPVLGEGFIAAEDQTAGLDLLKFKHANISKGILPADNKTGIEFFLQNGFQETGRAKRMIYGKEFDLQLDKVYSRIGGALG